MRRGIIITMIPIVIGLLTRVQRDIIFRLRNLAGAELTVANLVMQKRKQYFLRISSHRSLNYMRMQKKVFEVTTRFSIKVNPNQSLSASFFTGFERDLKKALKRAGFLKPELIHLDFIGDN